MFSFIHFSDGPLCVRIGFDVTEYFIDTESPENLIRPTIAQCRQHGRHSRLSGKSILIFMIFIRLVHHHRWAAGEC